MPTDGPNRKKRASSAGSNPFGRDSRIRVLTEYFEIAGKVDAENAWEHVYKCLLWMNEATGLAHIYDANHMQPGKFFHARAVRFTEELCKAWNIQKRELPELIDKLFKGCVAEWRKARLASPAPIDKDIESDLKTSIEEILKNEGVERARAEDAAKRIEALSHDFFTIGNKRKNALGEGFEDLLWMLLQRVAKVSGDKAALRTPVSKLPGFRKAAPRRPGAKREREPHPDLAFFDAGVTQIIVTAKWSMRQDRETQFHSEFAAYQRGKTQPTELQFALITNEFDTARLDNVARAIPTGAGGYIFHVIYHINPALLLATQQEKIGAVAHWIGAGKIRSLSDWLNEMRQSFGS